jgi:fermentation-respiration switch protein FrsA (DUF1100 family)
MLKPFLYIIVAILLFAGYVKYLEGRSIFFPNKNLEYSPGLINLGFEDIYLQTLDNFKIHGWFIPNKNAKYTLLFFHGNAGNIGHRLDKIKLLYDIGLNIFIIDYRGYGKSQGSPSEKGLYLDAKAARGYLVNNRNITPDNIILYGESLGAAVAVDLALQVKARALIIEEAFTNIADMAKRIYPFIPVFLISAKFDSLAKVRNINIPKLFIHSKDDEIVPLELGDKLYAAAKEPKRFAEISGSHNSAFLDSKKDYVSAIAAFIRELE